MSSEFGLPPTGHELIDALQGLQIVADHRDYDADRKIAHVRQTIGQLAAHQLLGRQFMVSAAQVLGKDPDMAQSERMLYRGLVFIAELESFGYVLDYDVPVDSLSLNFPNPEVIGVDEREGEKIRAFTFQVPILAIESCFDASAA